MMEIYYIICGVVALVPLVGIAVLVAWLFCGGSAMFRGQIALLFIFIMAIMSCGYATLWANAARWEKSGGIEVHWGIWVARTAALLLVGAVVSDFTWTDLIFGWIHLGMLGMTFAWLTASLVCSGSPRFVFYTAGVLCACATLFTYWVGAQITRKRGGQWRAAGAWVMMAVGVLGHFITALLSEPLADVAHMPNLFAYAHMVFDLVLFFGLELWCLVLTMPLPGQLMRLSVYQTQ